MEVSARRCGGAQAGGRASAGTAFDAADFLKALSAHLEVGSDGCRGAD
jgi:hypothetical protein